MRNKSNIGCQGDSDLNLEEEMGISEDCFCFVVSVSVFGGVSFF